MQDLAPIILFVYNRPRHTEQAINSLKKNELAAKCKLFIFSDEAKSRKEIMDVNNVRSYIKEVQGFEDVVIIEREKNFGLARSIISGVTEVLTRYEKVIVLEDDIVCGKSFLYFMNRLLAFFKPNPNVFSVSGYNFPIEIPDDYLYDIYFSVRPSSWGWGTWKDRWLKVDWSVKDYNSFKQNRKVQERFNSGGNDLAPMLDKQMKGKIDSWAIRWAYSHFKNNAYCVYPVKSRVINIGVDKSGTHIHKTKLFNTELYNEIVDLNLRIEIRLDEVIKRNFNAFFSRNKIHKIMDYIGGYFN